MNTLEQTTSFLLLAAALISGTIASQAADPTSPAEPADAAAVFERHLRAVGGEEAVRNLKTRITTSELEIAPYGITAKVDATHKAPNLFAITTTIDTVGEFQHVFDGESGWAVSPFEGLKEETGIGLANLKEDAELHLAARMNELFPGATLKGRQTDDGREVHVIELPGQQPNEAHFDVKTGLLVLRMKRVNSQSGVVIEQQKFENYREVDGVKIPFLITKSTPDITTTARVVELKQNVEIDDSRFAKPSN